MTVRSYVRGLETRVREMEKKLNMPPFAGEGHASLNDDHAYAESTIPVLGQHGSSTFEAVPNPTTAGDPGDFPMEPQIDPLLQEPPRSFVGELKTLSLEATAERHFGSTSGISFARLTQMVLRRLTPDKADFVFINHRKPDNDSGNRMFSFNSPSDLLNPSLLQSLNDSVSIHPILFGDVVLSDIADLSSSVADLDLPTDQAHIERLVGFYFAHSNTLYPILYRSEFLHDLRQVQENPEHPATNSPLCLFRIWMVLAIGSTAYSSVSLSDESESMLYYSKALEYLEQAIEYGEMVRNPEMAEKKSLSVVLL